MTQLSNTINKNLNNKSIKKFDSILIKQHINKDHPIMPIPEYFTLLDALCYIFNNNIDIIANLLQGYIDKNESAIGLMEALETGIKDKSVCLTCVKNDILNNYSFSRDRTVK
jgi:hypothetical protein